MFGRFWKRIIIGGAALLVAGVAIYRAIKNRITAKITQAIEIVQEEVPLKKVANGSFVVPRSMQSVEAYRADYEKNNRSLYADLGNVQEPEATLYSLPAYPVPVTKREVLSMLNFRNAQARKAAAVETGNAVKVDWRKPGSQERFALYDPSLFRLIEAVVNEPEPRWELEVYPLLGSEQIPPEQDNSIREEVLWAMMRQVENEMIATGKAFPSKMDLAEAASHMRDIREIAARVAQSYHAGTQGFEERFGEELQGIAPEGHLVPKHRPLMSPEQEGALLRRFGWHQREPFELIRYNDFMEWDKQRTRVMCSMELNDPWRPVYLPGDWSDTIFEMLDTLEYHLDGFASDDLCNYGVMLLTAIMAARNWGWGYPGEVGEERATALFKYCVIEFRRLIYITPSARDCPPNLASDTFEKFLEWISIPNPPYGDWMRHTPMIRVGKS